MTWNHYYSNSYSYSLSYKWEKREAFGLFISVSVKILNCLHCTSVGNCAPRCCFLSLFFHSQCVARALIQWAQPNNDIFKHQKHFLPLKMIAFARGVCRTSYTFFLFNVPFDGNLMHFIRLLNYIHGAFVSINTPQHFPSTSTKREFFFLPFSKLLNVQQI